jgi:sugar transferase (PEP-CTERM/EpsH1 system associated)
MPSGRCSPATSDDPAVQTDVRPLIAHVMHSFDTGGLENGVVNLINRLPSERYRHAVIALTEFTEFSRRIERDDVEFVALHKPPGQGFWMFPRMRVVLRQLRPAIVHTRNLAALEMSAPAAWSGVPIRVHGEHGWDERDPSGGSRAFRLVRRAYRPFVHRYVALSRQIRDYLVDRVGVDASKIALLYNGVDVQRFRPPERSREAIAGSPFTQADTWLVGTVGRLSPVKDQLLLARAFMRALELAPEARRQLRLVVVGEGPLRGSIEGILREGGASALSWLAGNRGDIPLVMRGLDMFVLPSIAEGISNTILEAMATALPIVATRVGGNAELLDDDTGTLVDSGDVEDMARAVLDDWRDRDAARARGRQARAEVERRFSLDRMVAGYAELYDGLLAQAAASGSLTHRYT